MNLVRRTTLPFLLSLSSLLCAVALLAGNAPSPAKLDYPKAKTIDQVDDYHGTKVVDPYRWLEDTGSPDTLAWVQAENKLTFSYLDQIPYRQAIRERLTKLWNYERCGVPEQQGGRYFYQHNNGLRAVWPEPSFAVLLPSLAAGISEVNNCTNGILLRRAR